MARYCWVGDDDGWGLLTLESAVVVAGGADQPVRLRRDRHDWASGVIQRRVTAEAGDETWVLLVPRSSSLTVNGLPVATGIRVLRDRDVLVAGQARLIFSSERLARVETFPGKGGDNSCPRCKQAIQGATFAVQCPQCGMWHHQSEEFPCWTYAETCALCDHPTNLDRPAFRWTPEAEEM